MIDTNLGFTLVRTFDATPEQIWNAWTNPDDAAQWLHPVGVTTPRESVEIDAREGGTYRYTMVDDATGDETVTAGDYREVIPFEKLLFTWGKPEDTSNDRFLITVTIEDLGELARMTFDLRGYAGMKGDEFIYDGWESALDSLATFVGQSEVLG